MTIKKIYSTLKYFDIFFYLTPINPIYHLTLSNLSPKYLRNLPIISGSITLAQATIAYYLEHCNKSNVIYPYPLLTFNLFSILQFFSKCILENITHIFQWLPIALRIKPWILYTKHQISIAESTYLSSFFPSILLPRETLQ